MCQLAANKYLLTHSLTTYAKNPFGYFAFYCRNTSTRWGIVNLGNIKCIIS